jgi:hypothetical protein
VNFVDLKPLTPSEIIQIGLAIAAIGYIVVTRSMIKQNRHHFQQQAKNHKREIGAIRKQGRLGRAPFLFPHILHEPNDVPNDGREKEKWDEQYRWVFSKRRPSAFLLKIRNDSSNWAHHISIIVFNAKEETLYYSNERPERDIVGPGEAIWSCLEDAVFPATREAIYDKINEEYSIEGNVLRKRLHFPRGTFAAICFLDVENRTYCFVRSFEVYARGRIKYGYSLRTYLGPAIFSKENNTLHIG